MRLALEMPGCCSLQLRMMRMAGVILVLYFSFFTSFADSFDINELQQEDEYFRPVAVSIAVVGDYAYVVGGRVLRYPNATGYEIEPFNGTASLPLGRSWESRTVRYQMSDDDSSLSDDLPNFYGPKLWEDPRASSFYLWGGEGFRSRATPRGEDFWVFETDGSGGGSWGVKDSPDSTGSFVFEELHNAMGRIHTTCNGYGFALGGMIYTTEVQGSNSTPEMIPELVTYQMTTSTWTADPIENFPYAPYQGQASCVPRLGDRGLVIFYGSNQGEGDTSSYWQDTELSTWTELPIYDPASKKWFWQKTTGEAPPPLLYRFCSVGVQGPNGTYEIFVFGGGRTKPPDKAWYSVNDVWILSLPGFHWFRVNTQTVSREDHACAAVGQRQMLVVGGWNRTFTPDSWEKAVGILDLTELTWTSGYDADALDYDTPDIVKQWYNDGGKAEWNSEELSVLFGETIDDEEPIPTPTKTPEPDSGSSTPVGAIAGGTVGGVAFLAIVIGGFFFWRRRQQRAANPQPPQPPPITETHDRRKSELPGENLPSPAPTYEMEASPTTEWHGAPGYSPHGVGTYPPHGTESYSPPPAGYTVYGGRQ